MSFPLKFFKDPIWEQEYVARTIHYKRVLEKVYPVLFDWEIDCQQVKEMVRAEMELERLDRRIGNDIENSSAFEIRQRKNTRDALLKYRIELGVTLKMRFRIKGLPTTKDASMEEGLKNLLANSEYSE